MQTEGPSYAEYVAARWTALRRTAFLLCGDRYRAEDLTQEVLTKLCVHWKRAMAARNLDAYVQRALVNTFLAEERKPWRQVMVTASVPDSPVEVSFPSDHDQALAALQVLGPSQRAIVVLRFWEDLSVEQTAALLGCSTGNVKSQTSRALTRLRQELDAEELS